MTTAYEQHDGLVFGADLALCVIESWREAVIVTDAVLEQPGPRIIAVNEAFCDMSGWSRDELAGRSPRVLQGQDTDLMVLRAFRRALDAERPFTGRAVNYRRDGSEYVVEWRAQPLRDANGELCGFVSLQRDVTSEVFLLNRAWEAWELDALTRCSHRDFGIRRLQMELARAQRYGSPLSMLMLEIGESTLPPDHRNDDDSGQGLEALLRGTGRMLMNRTRSSDLIVRWAPGCFLVLLPNTALGGAKELARGMVEAMTHRLGPDDPRLAGCMSVTECRPEDTTQSVIDRLQLELGPLSSPLTGDAGPCEHRP